MEDNPVYSPQRSTSSSVSMNESLMYLRDFNFTIEVRQIMIQISSSLQRERHFCSDAAPYCPKTQTKFNY
jgi:hypothetical protein